LRIIGAQLPARRRIEKFDPCPAQLAIRLGLDEQGKIAMQSHPAQRVRASSLSSPSSEKNLIAVVAPVQAVEDNSAKSDAGGSGHRWRITNAASMAK
jgi:hypothetical protein